MKIFITGANGFLGRFVTAAALEQGHEVIAAVRPASKAKFDDERVKTAHVDLRQADTIEIPLKTVDAVIHLAASKSGDFYEQFGTTVVGTENLLRAMQNAGVKKLVGISSFSVYEYTDVPKDTLIDEEALTITNPAKRDEYAQTKLEQEKLFHDFGKVAGNDVAIIRPGMIYGPGELWHPLLGSPLGPKFLKIGSKATLPMTYAANCADAIVNAAERVEKPLVSGQIFNIVDDDLPTQDEYATLVESRTDTPSSIKIPWSVWSAFTSVADKFNSQVLNGKAKVPGLFASTKVNARFKPMRYNNDKAKSLLEWSPRLTLEQSIDASIEIENK